jgi:hypothetical protein
LRLFLFWRIELKSVRSNESVYRIGTVVRFT